MMVMASNTNTVTIGTIMNSSNDSISRGVLLSLLQSREMTQGEMIELVTGAAPLEVDSVHNPYVTPTPPIEWYPIAGPGLPDHMG